MNTRTMNLFSPSRWVLAALLVLVALVPGARADGDSFDAERRAILEENRRIWERLTPAQRAEITERFNRLDEMWKRLSAEEREKERTAARQLIRRLDPDARYELSTPEGREEMRRRLARFRAITTAIIQNLPAEQRQAIDALPEAERESMQRYLWVVYLESRAAMLLDRQAEPVGRTYSKLRPNDQRQRLREWSAAWRDEILAGLSEEERTRIDGLPSEERARARRQIVTDIMAQTQFTVTNRIAAEQVPSLLQKTPLERAAEIDGEWFRLGAERFRDQFKRRFLVDAEDIARIDALPVEAQDHAIAHAIWKGVAADLRESGFDEEVIERVIKQRTWQEMADVYFRETWDGPTWGGPRPGHGGRPVKRK